MMSTLRSSGGKATTCPKRSDNVSRDHVVNDRHLRKRPMIFTTNKPLNEWGKVLHDEDMAAAILDRVLERGRFIHLDGPSGRTRHLNLEETLPENTKRLRISGTHNLRYASQAFGYEPKGRAFPQTFSQKTLGFCAL